MNTTLLLGILIFALMVTRLGFLWSKGHRARTAFQRGCQALEAGDWEEAEAALKRVVKLEPIFAVARRLLGRVLARRGALAEAEEQFRMAAALEPRNPDGYLDLGYFLALAQPSRESEAIDVLTKAVELAPGLRRTLATAAELEALRRHERFRRLIEA